jgi:MFS family permease
MVKTQFPLTGVWRQLSTNWLAYSAIILAAVMNGAMIAAQSAWWPTLFVRIHHWPSSRIGVTFAALGFPCGVFSALSAGWVMSWIAARGRQDGPILVLLAPSAIFMVFGFLKSIAPTPFLALALHVPTALSGIWAITAALTALNQITPNEMRSQVVALYSLATGLVAYTLGAASVGLLTDHLFRGPTGIGWGLGTVYAVCGAVGVAALIAGRSPFIAASNRAKAWTGR